MNFHNEPRNQLKYWLLDFALCIVVMIVILGGTVVGLNWVMP